MPSKQQRADFAFILISKEREMDIGREFVACSKRLEEA